MGRAAAGPRGDHVSTRRKPLDHLPQRQPDLPCDASINPYRGCEHGCAYCYARPTHELPGFSPGLDFETRILVKEEAPALLELFPVTAERPAQSKS